MTRPSWNHPINPSEIRSASDGRLALLLVLDTGTDPQDRWLVFDTPDGQLRATILEPDDVADWRVVYSMKH